MSVLRFRNRSPITSHRPDGLARDSRRRMSRTIGRHLAAASVLGFVGLAACGGGSDSGNPVAVATPAPTPTPTPCMQELLYQNQGSIPSGSAVVIDFTSNAQSRLDVIVDWTFEDSPIGVYVTPADSCNLEQFNARSCDFLIRSEGGGKPRRASATGVAAGNYDLLIANFAERDESASTQVFQSVGNCPAIASAASNGAEDGASLTVRSMVQ